MELASIYAVVANWNGGAENLECLRSLIAQGLSESNLVFVDNGSQRRLAGAGARPASRRCA